MDKEELRTDKAVEVPRKEQYDLIAELLELTPMFSTQEEEISRKKKIPDNITPPIETNTMVKKSYLYFILRGSNIIELSYFHTFRTPLWWIFYRYLQNLNYQN